MIDLKDLKPSTAYVLQVAAKNEHGWGEYGKASEFKTKEDPKFQPFKGIKFDIDESTLVGWKKVYDEPYSHHSSKLFHDDFKSFYAACEDAKWIMLGGRKHGTGKLQLAAMVSKEWFLKEDKSCVKTIGTTSKAVAHNGAYWYYTKALRRKAVGSAEEATISLNNPDTHNQNSKFRLSWRLTDYGYRCGSTCGLNDSTYHKVVYVG